MEQGPEQFLSDAVDVWRADGAGSNRVAGGEALTLNGPTLITSTGSDGWARAGVALFRFPGAIGSHAVTTTAPPGKPLHDGTGATLFLAYRAEPSSPQQILLATYPGGSVDVGATLWHDAARERVVWSVVNGDGVEPPYGFATWDGSVPNSVAHSLVVSFSDGVTIWRDGELIGTSKLGDRARDGVGAYLSAANPTSPRTVGNIYTSGYPLAGEIGEIGWKRGAITPAERSRLASYHSAHFGIANASPDRRRVIFDGNSLVHSGGWVTPGAFPSSVVGMLTHPVLAMSRGVHGLRTAEMVSRQSRHVLPDLRAGDVYVPWELINSVTQTSPVTKEEALASYWVACDAARALGALVIAMPPLPLDHPNIDEATWTWLRDGVVTAWPEHADRISLHYTDPGIGVWSARTDTSKFTDGVHLSQSTQAIVSEYVASQVDALLH